MKKFILLPLAFAFILSVLNTGSLHAQFQQNYLDHIYFDAADADLTQFDLKAISMGNLQFSTRNAQLDLFRNPASFYNSTRTQLFSSPSIQFAAVNGTELRTYDPTFLTSGSSNWAPSFDVSVHEELIDYEVPVGGIYRMNNLYVAGSFKLFRTSRDNNAVVLNNTSNSSFDYTQSAKGNEFFAAIGYRLDNNWSVGFSFRNFINQQDEVYTDNNATNPYQDLSTHQYDQQVYTLGFNFERETLQDQYRLKYSTNAYDREGRYDALNASSAYAFTFNRKRSFSSSEFHTQLGIQWKDYDSSGSSLSYFVSDHYIRSSFEDMNALILDFGFGLEKHLDRFELYTEFEYSPKFTLQEVNGFSENQYSQHQFILRTGFETPISPDFKLRAGIELNTEKVFYRSSVLYSLYFPKTRDLHLIDLSTSQKETVQDHLIQPVFTAGIEKQFSKLSLTYMIRYGTSSRTYRIPDDSSRILNNPFSTRLMISYPF